MRFLSCFVLLTCSLGCQSQKTAMEIICNAPTECTECKTAAPDMRAMLMAKHVEKQLWNRQAIKLMESLAMASPKERNQILLAEAKKAGLEKCTLATQLPKVP